MIDGTPVVSPDGQKAGDPLFKELILRSWRTSAVSIVTALSALVVNYGIEISPAAQSKLTELIVAAGVVLLGLFSKDGNVSGKKDETNGND